MIKVLILIGVLLVVMFFFFPKFLYAFLSAYFKNFRFTIPVTVGLVAGYLFYDFLKAQDPSGFSREAELLAKPVFMILLAGAILKFTSDFFKKL